MEAVGPKKVGQREASIDSQKKRKEKRRRERKRARAVDRKQKEEEEEREERGKRQRKPVIEFHTGTLPHPLPSPLYEPLREKRIKSDQQNTRCSFLHPKKSPFFCFPSIAVVLPFFTLLGPYLPLLRTPYDNKP